jgi:peroxiredoxin
MKKLILIAFLATPILAFAQQGQFNLKVRIGKVGKSAMVYLNYRDAGKSVFDSAAVINGVFNYKGAIGLPVKAQIVLDHAGVGLKNITGALDALIIYLEKGKITVNTKDSVKHALVSDSKLNVEYARYKKSISIPEQELSAVNAQYAAATADQRKDPAFRKSMQERINKALKEEKVLNYQYIRQNKSSYISLMVLSEMAGSTADVNDTESAYNNLSADLRDSQVGLNIKKTIESAHATAIGSMAPVFIQNDVNDRPVSLSDFKGKYVLLDFWASWCGPCRAENPNVVKAYQQYKNKNFTVLGVSLDQPGKKESWLAAIKADGLDWAQVSDLKFWNNAVARQYGVRGIPQNFLIDPSGKIVAKNLRGAELHSYLNKLFDSKEL